MPTPAELERGRQRTRHEPVRRRHRASSGDDGRQRRRLQPAGIAARRSARGEVSAHARLPARGRGEQVQRSGTYKSDIKGAPSGKLKGKTVALKDNVCVAGVPMMNGASTLEGYVPDVDATVVTRILDAGATIVGKVALRVLLLLRRQPHQRRPGRCTIRASTGYSAGGSSSGSAAVVVAGRGRHGDRRRPGRLDPHAGVLSAASSGMKPTHGLVPYTGIMPIELTHRPYRADDRDRRRQRADAGSHRRAGRARPAPDAAARSTPTPRRWAAAPRA